MVATGPKHLGVLVCQRLLGAQLYGTYVHVFCARPKKKVVDNIDHFADFFLRLLRTYNRVRVVVDQR